MHLIKGQAKAHHKKTAAAQLAISNNGAPAEDLAPAFAPEEEKHFERRHENDFDVADPQYMCWLIGCHPDKFQELSSSGVSLAATFAESLQSDTFPA